MSNGDYLEDVTDQEIIRRRLSAHDGTLIPLDEALELLGLDRQELEAELEDE